MAWGATSWLVALGVLSLAASVVEIEFDEMGAGACSDSQVPTSLVVPSGNGKKKFKAPVVTFATPLPLAVL